MNNDEILKKLNNLKYFVLDVDGTMTDSGIYFDDSGREIKRFSSRDYVGAMAAHYIGIKLIVVTGRESKVTTRRMEEMMIDYVFQRVKDKRQFLLDFMKDNQLETGQLGYLGDDLNDYAAMSLAGFKACPADSAVEIKNICDYISECNGGMGVVQDTFRFVLETIGKWDSFIKDVVVYGY